MNFFSISLVTIIILLLKACALTLVIILVRKALKYIGSGIKESANVRFYYFISRTIAWIIFFIYCLFVFIRKEEYLLVAISLILLILSYNMVKNIILGVFFRLQKGNQVGVNIRLENITGVILDYDLTSIEIQVKNADKISVPYSKVYTDIITYPSKSSKVNEGMLIFKIGDFDDNHFFEKLKSQKEEIRKQILLLPYVSINKNIIISFEEDEDGEILKICYSIDNSNYASKAKFDIEDIVFKISNA